MTQVLRSVEIKMWERACSRMRWVSQQMWRLIYRIREQARSHIFEQCQALAGATDSSTTSGRLISAYTNPVNTLPATIASKYNSA